MVLTKKVFKLVCMAGPHCETPVIGAYKVGDRAGDVAELRSCVKVEVAVLGSPSLIVRTVFVDVKQY